VATASCASDCQTLTPSPAGVAAPPGPGPRMGRVRGTASALRLRLPPVAPGRYHCQWPGSLILLAAHWHQRYLQGIKQQNFKIVSTESHLKRATGRTATVCPVTRTPAEFAFLHSTRMAKPAGAMKLCSCRSQSLSSSPSSIGPSSPTAVDREGCRAGDLGPTVSRGGRR